MVPQYESATYGKFQQQNGLKGLQVVQFECPRHSNPSVSSIYEVGKIHFFHSWVSEVIINGLPQSHYKDEIIENFKN